MAQAKEYAGKLQVRFTYSTNGSQIYEMDLQEGKEYDVPSIPFEEDALVRISPSDIRKKGKVPKNGSVFFTIFQTFMTNSTANIDSSKPGLLKAASPSKKVEYNLCL